MTALSRQAAIYDKENTFTFKSESVLAFFTILSLPALENGGNDVENEKYGYIGGNYGRAYGSSRKYGDYYAEKGA